MFELLSATKTKIVDVDIVFRRMSSLTKAECAELLEYVIAFATEHGPTRRGFT